ncbi:MAG: arylsulfatase A-like enzyme [Saprospiraceae bacterium]|jgi:arylsulfatase A-like enzyme
MKRKLIIYLLCIGFLGCSIEPKTTVTGDRRNVLVIMIDDLNDCIGGWNGHPQSLTPNINRLAASGTSFTNAHTNAPMCGPARASLFTGIYPHNSRNFYQAPWYKSEVLRNSKTMMEQFKDAGYYVTGSGKLLHHNIDSIWSHFENPADYTPTPYDGVDRLPHPDVPAPFSDIGWVDGSLGPFINLEGRKSAAGRPLQWVTGGPKVGFKEMKYIDDDNRDPTPDEVNASWAAERLIAFSNSEDKNPFFLAVGFLRPHTPLVALQKYFDRFPLDQIQVTITKSEDNTDTFLKVAYNHEDVHALRFGRDMFDAITKAYGSTEAGLKRWIQAYLACVAAVDDNVGQVLEALAESKLVENTIIVLASDHGFHMGEKDYLYKNSLWEESTRVPLIVKVPGITQAGSKVQSTVSLIDVYPSLMDLCNIELNTLKNKKGHHLDGLSFRALLENPTLKAIAERKPALTVVYAGDAIGTNPEDQHYTIRTEQYRYILYNSGHEELYDHETDPFEWNNLARGNDKYESSKKKLRNQLKDMVSPYQLVGFSQLK